MSSPKPTATNRAALAKLIRRCADVNTPNVLEADAALLANPHLETEFRRADWFAAVIDRAPVFSKDTLLHAIYQSCALPAHFGFNWDALVDALSDLPADDVQGYALILKSPEVLRTRAHDVYDTFLEVIDAVNERYAGEGKPFKLVVGAGART